MICARPWLSDRKLVDRSSGPFHRTAERLRGMCDADIFGIVEVLHAERATNVGGQDTNLVVWHVQELCQRHLVAGNPLGRNLKCEAFAGLVVGGQCDARLHRHHGDPGVDDIKSCHMGGAGEGGIDLGGVAVVIVERHVVGDVIVELRGAGFGGFLGIGHGRKRFDIEFHGFSGVAPAPGFPPRRRQRDRRRSAPCPLPAPCGWSAAAGSRRGSSAADRR